MERSFQWRLLLLAGACCAATAGSAWAQGTAAAGRFLSVTGDVRVQAPDGKRRTAERGAEFREGDTIVTGPNALAQMRTADGGLVSVRADTEMKLDKFAYAGEKDSNASFLVSLVKGGFRTITGLIGRANRDGYKVTTPSATIGIRGTHFELVHVLPQAASQQAPAGTYNRVFDGITTMQNKTGVLVLVNRDQTAFVSLPGNVAPVLVIPPAPVFGKPTPVPRLVPQSSSGGSPTAGGGDGKTPATGAVASPPATLVRPTTTLTPLTTTISPIETTTTIKSTTTLSPSTSTLISPITTTTTTTLSPTTSTLSTTTLTSPTTSTLSTTTLTSPTTSTLSTTTLSPTTTILSPTTSTLSTTTLTAPTTTTTTISPTTTTISPILTSPTTTTILK
jgi:FecR-like protein